MVPWVPLARSDQPPEQLLARCVERIDAVADPTRREALLAVTEILAGLAFPDRRFPTLFRGFNTVIESPVLDEWAALVEARGARKNILRVLTKRLGPVPEPISAGLQAVADSAKLDELVDAAAVCATFEDFEVELRKRL